MAKPISVNEILTEAKSAKEALDTARERVRNIKKVATTLESAGLLDEESAKQVADIFPTRAPKAEGEDGNDGNDGNENDGNDGNENE